MEEIFCIPFGSCFRFSTVVMHHHVYSNLGMKGFFFVVVYASTSLFIIKGSQDRNPEIEGDAEALEGCCILACISWLGRPTYL